MSKLITNNPQIINDYENYIRFLKAQIGMLELLSRSKDADRRNDVCAYYYNTHVVDLLQRLGIKEPTTARKLKNSEAIVAYVKEIAAPMLKKYKKMADLPNFFNGDDKEPQISASMKKGLANIREVTKKIKK